MLTEDMVVFWLALDGATTEDIESVPFKYEQLWSGDQPKEDSR